MAKSEQLMARCLCHFLPLAHVCDTVLIAGNDYFCSFRQRFAAFAARAARLPCSGLREDNLARAAFANRAANVSQDSDAIEIGRVQLAVMLHEKFHDE